MRLLVFMRCSKPLAKSIKLHASCTFKFRVRCSRCFCLTYFTPYEKLKTKNEFRPFRNSKNMNSTVRSHSRSAFVVRVHASVSWVRILCNVLILCRFGWVSPGIGFTTKSSTLQSCLKAHFRVHIRIHANFDAYSALGGHFGICLSSNRSASEFRCEF